MSDSTDECLAGLTEAAVMGSMPVKEAVAKAYELGVLCGELKGMDSARKTFMAGLRVPA